MPILSNRRWYFILAIIGGIYSLSFFIQLVFPIEDKPYLNQESITVELDGEMIDHSYLAYVNSDSDKYILLFPDPFYGIDNLEPLAQNLSDSINVLIPIYPKTTRDGSRVNQSSEKYSRLMASVIDSLELSKVHIAGQGFGNSVAIEFANSQPENRLQSFSMLGGIGVQELNYLGYHVLNSAVYTFIYAGTSVIQYGLPHAGWAQHIGIDMQLARFLSNLDQRNYRRYLNDFDRPTLILHAEEDLHVPFVNALEHHRIIPQSELIRFDGGHDSIFKNSAAYSNEILNFISQISAEQSITRGEAASERIAQSEDEFDSSKREVADGWTLTIAIVLIALISVISEDLAAIGGGLVVASGGIHFGHALFGSLAGILITDVIIYWLGRYVGSPVLRWIPFRWIVKEKDIIWADSMFKNNGLKIIFISRFLPGTRFPTYFSAGIVKANFSLFLLYFLLAIAIWAPLVVGLSVMLGTQMLVFLEIYQDYALYIIVGFVVAMFMLIKLLLPLSTRKGRKEFAFRVIRLKQKYIN